MEYAINNSFMNTKYVTEKDILSLKYEINSLELDNKIIINNREILLNDYDNPISLTNNFLMKNTLSINPDYYKEHKTDINRLMIDFIKNYKDKVLYINSSKLINSEVISSIANNNNIQEVYLGTKDDVYKLKEEDYNKLNNGTITNIVTYGVEK